MTLRAEDRNPVATSSPTLGDDQALVDSSPNPGRDQALVNGFSAKSAKPKLEMLTDIKVAQHHDLLITYGSTALMVDVSAFLPVFF